MSVDFDALQAHQGPKAVLAQSVQIDGLTNGHSDAVQGFSGLDSVYVEVVVDAIRARYGPRRLTVLVESSSDGNSWSTEHTFTLGTPATVSTTVDSPPDYLRLSWTPANFSEWVIASATAAPPTINTAGGGGGSDQLSVATFNFTAADIKSSTLTPLVMIPAPGAGKILIPVTGIMVITYGGTPFPSTNTEFTTAAAGGAALGQGGLWNQTTDQVMVISALEGQGELTDLDNGAFVMRTQFPGAVASVSVGSGGSGYSVNDVIALSDTGNADATCKVTSVSGGAITGLLILIAGTGYTIGSQSFANGAGNGDATVNIETIDASGVAGNGTAQGEMYYLVHTI